VPTEAELARAQGRDYEPASVLLERILAERRCRWQEAAGRGKYEEPVVPDATDLPELPEGWCWSTVDALTISGSQNGLYVPKAKYGAGVPILRIDDYQTDWSRSSNELQRVDISDVDAEKYGLAVGDIVINRVNSPSHLGKSLAVLERNMPAVFESNMMRFALAVGVIPGFIQHYLSSTEGKARLTKNVKWAVNQASINQGDVGTTAVPLPPVTEQRRIVAELGTLLSTVAASEVASAVAAARCARLRQAILKWAFEGRLVDQDPSDEPASVLLERIRTETAARTASAATGAASKRRGRRGTMTSAKNQR
jgi:type I restriction enzyme S subunit